MNVYFFFPCCWTPLLFDSLSVLVVRGGAVCLPTPPSWFFQFLLLNSFTSFAPPLNHLFLWQSPPSRFLFNHCLLQCLCNSTTRVILSKDNVDPCPFTQSPPVASQPTILTYTLSPTSISLPTFLLALSAQAASSSLEFHKLIKQNPPKWILHWVFPLHGPFTSQILSGLILSLPLGLGSRVTLLLYIK